MTDCTPECGHPRGGECHCCACHRTFTALTPFDAHQQGDRCVDPDGATHTKGKKAGQPIFAQVERRGQIMWSGYREEDGRPWDG